MRTGNAVITRAGNGFSVSKKTTVGAGKIDGVAAMLNAVQCCASSAGNEISIYVSGERDGLLFV
jgi:hypothetical protein